MFLLCDQNALLRFLSASIKRGKILKMSCLSSFFSCARVCVWPRGRFCQLRPEKSNICCVRSSKAKMKKKKIGKFRGFFPPPSPPDQFVIHTPSPEEIGVKKKKVIIRPVKKKAFPLILRVSCYIYIFFVLFSWLFFFSFGTRLLCLPASSHRIIPVVILVWLLFASL